MKVSVNVAMGDSVRRVSWYDGTSDAQVETAMRLLLRLPSGASFLLRDGDGDLVPVSAALPANQLYTLVLSADLLQEPKTVTEAGGDDVASTTETTSLVTRRPAETLTLAADAVDAVAVKRRKLEDDVDVTVAEVETPVKICEAAKVVTTPRRRPSGPSLAATIAQFVEAFTRPIDNDDNVSFIPNTGRFALDELYYELVQDPRCHPKGRDIFYKMTSLYGKVDRQRVVRYYRCQAEGGEGIEVVRSRPEGKGSLLRRYRKVVTAQMLEDAMKSEPFVVSLGLDPKDVVARYMRFVNSFTPISRTEYHAYCETSEEAD